MTATRERAGSGMIFSFGQSQHDRIEVDVLRYERAPVGDWHDDNWLTVQIRVAAGGFRGKVEASIITAELADFLAQVRSLNEMLEGSAVFTTIEEQLELTLTGDGRGHITLSGKVADQPGIGNRLFFECHFDQSQLHASVRDLAQIVENFPVRSP